MEIARANHARLFGDAGELTTAGAEDFAFDALGPRLICFLYNPFGAATLRRMLGRLRGAEAILIYNNPAEDEAVRAAGFVPWRRREGGCPNARTYLYHRAAEGGN